MRRPDRRVRRVTMTDIAREAGCSQATVSFVINNAPGIRLSDETRRRVLDAARRLGYSVPAGKSSPQQQAGRRNRRIGFIVDQLATSPEAVQAIEGLTQAAGYLGRGQPVYLIIYISMVVFFAFFYTAVVFNPTETADNLKRYGGFIPGIRPGTPTAEHLDYVLTRITTIGALYLVFICLLPEFMLSRYSLPFYFGGTSLLIVVTVTLDTVG